MLTDGKNTTGRAPAAGGGRGRGGQGADLHDRVRDRERLRRPRRQARTGAGRPRADASRSPQLTNGRYFAAATADELKTVYENIGSDVGYEKADREVTSRFAGYGLAFAVLAALGAISLGAKWP